MVKRRRPIAALCALAAVLEAPTAHAQKAAACAESADKGQELRDEGKLVASREPFSACASASCPVVVQRECVRWLEEVDARIPTVVVSVKDAQGRDTRATLTIDGAAIDANAGRAMRFDPGEHVFRAAAPGAEGGFVEERVVLREREKDRTITLVMKASRAADPSPQPADPAPKGGIPALSWVLGGVAVAGGVGYGVFWTKGTGRADELRTSCSPYCAESEVDEARTSLNIARVSLVVGVAAAIGAVTVFLLQPRAVPKGATATLPLGWRF